MWPKEIRSDLRAGMKAKHYKDFDLSERYIRRYGSIQMLTNHAIERTPSGLGRQLKPCQSRPTVQILIRNSLAS
jgi:hypothetical protein